MVPKRAFFGTFWRGGLGAIGRCLSIAQSLKSLGFSCYFFAEDVAESFVCQAGFIPVRPPQVAPPREGFGSPYVSEQRVVGVGAVFSNLGEFYAMRGYGDSEYVERAFGARFRTIENIGPDILFGYWSWETTIAARVIKKPLVGIIQQSLHPSGGGFIDVQGSARKTQPLDSFNNLLKKLHHPSIDAVEELMMGDVTLISGVPSTDQLPVDDRTRYCGPLLWFPRRGKNQLQSIPKDRKVAWVYGTDCDSWVGGRFLIREIVPLLADMGFFVLISSGGHRMPLVHHPEVLCVENIPGDLAARRAELVVGRGGHDLFWTAIMAGKPFFGAPPNSEWLNYCQCARSLGVGDYVEIDSMNRSEIVYKIGRLVTSSQVAIRIEELRLEAEKCAARTSPLSVLQEFWPELLTEIT